MLMRQQPQMALQQLNGRRKWLQHDVQRGAKLWPPQITQNQESAAVRVLLIHYYMLRQTDSLVVVTAKKD